MRASRSHQSQKGVDGDDGWPPRADPAERGVFLTRRANRGWPAWFAASRQAALRTAVDRGRRWCRCLRFSPYLFLPGSFEPRLGQQLQVEACSCRPRRRGPAPRHSRPIPALPNGSRPSLRAVPFRFCDRLRSGHRDRLHHRRCDRLHPRCDRLDPGACDIITASLSHRHRERLHDCHCERSEAIQTTRAGMLECFVAPRLAMPQGVAITRW